MKKKLAIISHSADLDGLMSGQIIWDSHSDGEWEKHAFPHDYGDDHDLLISRINEINPDKVVMADLSLPFSHMEELNSNYDFTWIDHHKSAIDELPGYKGVQVIGTAACILCWRYFKDSFPPINVRCLGQYDVWEKYGEFIWEEVLQHQYGCRGIAKTFPNENLHRLWSSIAPSDIIEKGKILLNNARESAAALAEKYSFEKTLMHNSTPYRIIAINSNKRSSMALESVFDETKHDIMCCYFYNGKGNWVHSFYTTKDDVDCSAIAKFFGGGGHQKAAGCQLDSPLL